MGANKDIQIFPNARHGDGNGLSMDTQRAERFAGAMFRIYRAVHSLSAAAATFPKFEAMPGCMDAGATVNAFAGQLDADIQLMFRMIENEEGPEKKGE